MPYRGGRNEGVTTAPVQVAVAALEATRSNGRQHPNHRALLATRFLRHHDAMFVTSILLD